jgi:hypothetical protein
MNMLRRSLFAPLFAVALSAFGCVNNVSGGGGGNGGGDNAVCGETTQQACKDKAGADGVAFCFENEDGDAEWTACCVAVPEDPCSCSPPGEECNTPLVLAFESEAVAYTSEMTGSFDLSREGMSAVTDWPTAKTPWLALDRNENGQIDGAAELFGSASKLSDTAFAPNGFVALRLLDDNGDRVLDAADPGFARLLLWSDKDASRSSDSAELTPAASRLLSIDLSYSADPRCDERGNCEVERAGFRYLDASGKERTGAVVDVHLRTQTP